MKNKKLLIISVIVIILVAIIFGVYKIYSLYLFNQDGIITDGHQELIEHLKNIENKDERKNQINFSVEYNLISQEEANTLY